MFWLYEHVYTVHSVKCTCMIMWIVNEHQVKTLQHSNSFSIEHISLPGERVMGEIQFRSWLIQNSSVCEVTHITFLHLFNTSPRKVLSQFNDYRVQTVVDNGVTRQPNCVVRTEVQAPPHWQRLPIREFNRKSMWYIRPIFLLLSSWWNIQSQILVCVQAVLLRIPCEYFLLFDWSETETYSMWTFRESPFARFVQRHSLLFCEPTLLSQKFK